MRSLDIRAINRADLLIPGNLFSWSWNRDGATTGAVLFCVEPDKVIFNYRPARARYTGGASAYAVSIDRTPCALGGQRVWWRCPAAGCDRRVAVLYGGPEFACRLCLQLAYRSQRELEPDRAARRVDAIRARLGWEPGFLNGGGSKPTGMHRATFETLRTMHDDCVIQILTDFLERNPPVSGPKRPRRSPRD